MAAQAAAKRNTYDTIAAISTAPGEGGIGIVRISGPKALSILELLIPGGGALRRESFLDRKMIYGIVREPSDGKPIDEALAVYMKAPRSYTGEDVCEVQCHGGPVPVRKILEVALTLGARTALPGEFTKRAFLNGRLDLAQAGAVIDMIRAGTEQSYRAARALADGGLSERIRSARELLLTVLAEITARIEYSEVFEDEDAGGEISSNLNEAAKLITALLADADRGRLVREGLRVCIIGKPNAGKSSLYNALLREDAAIVTATPGTTRDVLEVMIDVNGVPVILTDTAGIRGGAGEIERIGIDRAREVYERADVCLFVVDGSKSISDEDRMIAALLNPDKKTIIVVTKNDLPQNVADEDVKTLVAFAGTIVRTALGENSSYGILEIEEYLSGLVLGGSLSAGAPLLVTKAYHKAALEESLNNVEAAVLAIDSGEAPEFAEIDIHAAYDKLGEIIGETVTDDILERVFSEFCVGK